MMPRRKPSIDIRRCAREKLGFESLREGQEEAVRSLLEGRDTVVVQPTGSGKSAIYQIAGLMIPGATLVVSPLLALQRDQLDAIAAQPHEEGAAALNSANSASGTRSAFTKLRAGELEYLFVAPEQLRKQEVADAIRDAGISLFVVDEAHCISEWGHDFRPDYLRLGDVIEALGHPTTLALTATASRAVREEIVGRLRMREPKVIVTGFDRPNIALRVDKFDSEEAKLAALVHRVRWAEKPGIIYVATRGTAEEVTRALRAEGCEADFYHAGLRAREREAVQERFMSGRSDLIVATNAFGMGIDKADVRFVYHFDVPESLDSYYQEVGRAGRDGKPAEAVLFFRPQNAGIRRFQAGGGKLRQDEVERVLRGESEGIGPKRIEMIRQLVADARGTDLDIPALAASIVQRRELLLRRRKERLGQMLTYASISTCRREFLLRYFDDEWGACVKCDNCVANAGHFLPAALGGGTRREVASG